MHSKNDFKEAIKLIEDISADTNVKSNGDKKVFNDLNELINNIKNKKTSRKSIINWVLSIVTEAKNNGFRTNRDEREITLDNAESLLKDLGNGILNRREF